MKISILGGSRLKVFLYGFLIWTLWVLFYAVFFKIQTSIPSWSIAFAASAGAYYTFALLSILIWFICRKIPFDILPIPILVSIHFFISMIISALWLFIYYGLWYLNEGKEIFTYYDVRSIFGWQFLFGMITYLLIAGIFYTIIYYKQFREKELQEAELKLLTRDAELKALKMQINPHFLFNSLNSINALVTKNSKQARDMIAKLSDLLRISLESRDEMLVPLKEELDLARLYLEIEKIRFSDRMTIHEEIDPELLNISFPAMVLQPLLENTVKHGITSHRGRGTIKVTVKKKDEKLCCIITNSVGKKKSDSIKQPMSNGTGLINIRRRLELLYKDAFSFVTDFSDSEEFRVVLLIPFEKYG